MKCGDDVLKFLTESVRTTIGEKNFTDAHALQIELKMRRQFGGSAVYIPKFDHQTRRESIKAEFNGRNRKELCQKYDLSKAQFYRFIKGE